jgi:uncharacterized membrane protein
MLVTFPYALFVSAVLFDLANVAGGPAFLGAVGHWTVVAALIAAALAGLAGMVDLWDAPDTAVRRPGPGRGDRTRRTAVTFNLVNAAMAGLFVVVCLVRSGLPEYAVTGGLVMVEILALGVGAIGVRLGSRLVRQFDVGRGEATTFEALGATPGAVLREAAARAR